MAVSALRRVVRSIHSSGGGARLTRFSLHPPKYKQVDGKRVRGIEGSWKGKMMADGIQVEVEFSDGCAFKLSAEFLRVYSPAVDSKIRFVGGEKVIFGRCYVGIMSAEPVGNYGVRLLFDDLHKTGIYTWEYFYHLGSNKFSLMRNYVKTLKKHGLSRDPKRK